MSDQQATTSVIQKKSAQQPALGNRLLQGKSTARKRQRAAESPDHRALQLEQQREYQRAYRRRKAAATTEQIPGAHKSARARPPVFYKCTSYINSWLGALTSGSRQENYQKVSNSCLINTTEIMFAKDYDNVSERL